MNIPKNLKAGIVDTALMPNEAAVVKLVTISGKYLDIITIYSKYALKVAFAACLIVSARRSSTSLMFS